MKTAKFNSKGYVPECIKAAMRDIFPQWDGRCRGCEFSRDPARYDGGCLLTDNETFIEGAIISGLLYNTPEELQAKIDETKAFIRQQGAA